VIRGWDLARVKRHATGFAGIHSLNAGLSLAYSLVQTVVFARSLDHRTFALTVLFQAVGIYLIPLNQCVARANFVLLRERSVRDGVPRAPEAAVAFNVNQIILLIMPLAIPLGAGLAGPLEYLSFACFLFFVTFTNLWFCEIQMAMMAIDRAIEYERVALVRRIAAYATLVMLLVTHDFLMCNLALALQTLFFHVLITKRIAKGAGLFEWPSDATRAGMWNYLGRLWISLQATGAEWLTMSAPYAIFFLRFGVGPGLVTVDAMLKLLRMVVSISRNLAEIALPSVSRAIMAGNTRVARGPAVFALAGGGLGALAIAVLVIFWERFSFGLLLGPNNVVPHGAGLPTGLAMVAGVAVATGGHFIGHTGDRRSIPALSLIALATVGSVAAFTVFARPDIVQALWAVSVGMTVIAIAAIGLLVEILRR
jgi:hypothetical protein